MTTVYLDQNHWIYLAKELQGDPHKPEHAGIADAIREKIQANKMRLPMSVLHLIELYKAGSSKRRDTVARVYEDFARGLFMVPQADIVPQELKKSLYAIFKPEAFRPVPVAYGQGIMAGLSQYVKETLKRSFTEEQFNVFETATSFPGAILDIMTFPNEENRLAWISMSRFGSPYRH